MNAIQAYAERCSLVLHLRESGYRIKDVCKVMRLTPENVRRHEARALRNRMNRPLTQEENAMIAQAWKRHKGIPLNPHR